ncbi:MAG: preprotein translocase subunit SecE [Pyrinomonadaceae bacterium]
MSTANEAESKGGIGQFIKDTRSEWDKTTFPSAQDVRDTTIIVLFAVVFLSVFLMLVDNGWTWLLGQLTSAVGWLLS